MKEITIKIPDDPQQLEKELRARLARGVVFFLYKKKSTEQLRVARGTTMPTLFDYEFKTGKRREIPGHITYWDLDKGNWRQLLTKNIIALPVTAYTVTSLPHPGEGEK